MQYSEGLNNCSLLGPSSLPSCQIGMFPDDLLLEIFFYLCDEKGVQVTLPADGVWHLRQVCSRWRSLVHSTPSLWNRFDASNPYGRSNSNFDPFAVAKRIQTCLKYSQSAPLSIAIARLPIHTNDALRFAIQEVAIHAHRLVSLNVDGNILENIFGEFTFTATQLPNLHTFIVTKCRNPAAYRFIQGANSLEDVTITASVFPSAFDFPWANVKRLSATNTAFEPEYDIGALFCAIPYLEKLYWKWNRDLLMETPSVVTLPHLQSLSVEVPSRLYTLMSKLCVPRLANLKINADSDLFTVPLLKMIQMSKCCIKKLDMSWDLHSAVVRILSDCDLSGLENLSIVVSTIKAAQEILPRLIWDYEAHLLPSLQNIYIDVQPHNFNKATELTEEIIVGLRRIMSSRRTVAGRQNVLHLVECTASVAEDKYGEYKTKVNDLEDLGKELGIQVEFGLLSFSD